MPKNSVEVYPDSEVRPTGLTDGEKFRLLQLVSGHFLTHWFPDDWCDMSEERQAEFITANCWLPFEGWEADEVYSLVEEAADCAIDFIDKEILPKHSIKAAPKHGLTDEQEFCLLKQASTTYLVGEIPDDWRSLPKYLKERFVMENTSYEFKTWHVGDIIRAMERDCELTISFIRKEGLVNVIQLS